jgi:hypothetical protein
MSFSHLRRRTGILLAFGVIAAAASSVSAQGPSAATCTKSSGVLLAPSGTTWKAIPAGTAVPTDTPLVSLFDTTLASAKGSVTARLLADPAQRRPLPILESAVIVNADKEHDLSLTLLRGLIVLNNTRKQGPATVRFTSRGEALDVTLKEPGAKLALELYSRHVPGAPHVEDPKEDVPVLHLFCIQIKGESLLQHKDKSVTLHEPPGPAVLVWDSITREPEIQRLEQMPQEIAMMKVEDVKLLEQACAWARKLATEAPEKAFKEGLASESSCERKAAVTAMGAMDDVRGLFDVLAHSPHSDAREHAILALRGWLGREPGQTAKLLAGFQKAGLTKTQSENVLHLLYGFTADERRQPGTYDLLIETLQSQRPAMRELAHWHLVRLAPAGKSIAYDAQAPEAQRQSGYEEWRKLIPHGKLPPAPSTKTR